MGMNWAWETHFKKHFPLRRDGVIQGDLTGNVKWLVRVALIGISLGGLVCASFFFMGFLGMLMAKAALNVTIGWKIAMAGIWGVTGAMVCGTAGFLLCFKIKKHAKVDLDLIAFLLGATAGWLLTLGLILFWEQ